MTQEQIDAQTADLPETDAQHVAALLKADPDLLARVLEILNRENEP